MSIAAIPVSPPVGYHPARVSDADFERRWNAWRERGFAHERRVRRRLLVVAMVAGAVALVATVLFVFSS